MAETTRTFIAVPLTVDRLTKKLQRLQSLVAPELPGVRWTAPDQFHLTLAFLGDVAHSDLREVCKAVTETTVAHSKFSLILGTLGCFPSPENPRTIWIGLSGPAIDQLNDLQQDIARSVRSLGYPPDSKFSPHITLGRARSGRKTDSVQAEIGPLLAHYRTWAAGLMPIAEVVTYSSSMAPEGPVYAVLAKGTLATT
ncbi:RNA 2',3'-cyclic phosphodiesterase [Isosphaeraceae bacterium EP7]